MRALWDAKRTERQVLLAILGILLIGYFMPAGNERFENARLEGVYVVHWYAQERVIR